MAATYMLGWSVEQQDCSTWCLLCPCIFLSSFF